MISNWKKPFGLHVFYKYIAALWGLSSVFVFILVSALLQISVHHNGYFEFRLCPNDNIQRTITQACLNRYLLPIYDDNGGHIGTRYNITNFPAPFPNNIYHVNVRLPDGLTCTQCVLQWKYNAGMCSVIGQGKRTKFDRLVDPNVRGAQRRVYSDLRIYRNLVISSK